MIFILLYAKQSILKICLEYVVRSIQSFFACQMESVQQIRRQIRMTMIIKK